MAVITAEHTMNQVNSLSPMGQEDVAVSDA